MTERDLRVCFETAYKMISRERRTRETVLANSPLLKAKLAECDAALAAVMAMKDELKARIAPAVQEALFDVPETKKIGGY